MSNPRPDDTRRARAVPRRSPRGRVGRGVSVEGPVELTTLEHDELEMATRSLGAELGAWYVEHNPRGDGSVVVVLTPEHWRTYDVARVLD